MRSLWDGDRGFSVFLQPLAHLANHGSQVLQAEPYNRREERSRLLVAFQSILLPVNLLERGACLLAMPRHTCNSQIAMFLFVVVNESASPGETQLLVLSKPLSNTNTPVHTQNHGCI